MDKSICTPLNSHVVKWPFWMSGNDRGRSVNPPDFWSFNFIDVRGLPLPFGSKRFTGFEFADLASWSSSFLLLLFSKKRGFLERSNFQDLQFQTQWRCSYQIEVASPWHLWNWMTKSWGDLLTSLYHFKSFQKGHFTMWLFNGVQDTFVHLK